MEVVVDGAAAESAGSPVEAQVARLEQVFAGLRRNATSGS
jgi:hypothetical protein